MLVKVSRSKDEGAVYTFFVSVPEYGWQHVIRVYKSMPCGRPASRREVRKLAVTAAREWAEHKRVTSPLLALEAKRGLQAWWSRRLKECIHGRR